MCSLNSNGAVSNVQDIWSVAEGEAVGKHVVHALAWLFFRTKRATGHLPRPLRWLLMPPLRWFSGRMRQLRADSCHSSHGLALVLGFFSSAGRAPHPAGLIGSALSRTMLVACEVAVEYWMALTWSPQVPPPPAACTAHCVLFGSSCARHGSLSCGLQLALLTKHTALAAPPHAQAQWLRESEQAGRLQVRRRLLCPCKKSLPPVPPHSWQPSPLCNLHPFPRFACWRAAADTDPSSPAPARQAEIAEESKRVSRFIVDREIEAPERFQAIQSYRLGSVELPGTAWALPRGLGCNCSSRGSLGDTRCSQPGGWPGLLAGTLALLPTGAPH